MTDTFRRSSLSVIGNWSSYQSEPSLWVQGLSRSLMTLRLMEQVWNFNSFKKALSFWFIQKIFSFWCRLLCATVAALHAWEFRHRLEASSYQPVSGKSLHGIVIAPLSASNQCKRLRPGTKAPSLFWLSDVGLQLQTHPAPTAQLWRCT